MLRVALGAADRGAGITHGLLAFAHQGMLAPKETNVGILLSVSGSSGRDNKQGISCPSWGSFWESSDGLEGWAIGVSRMVLVPVYWRIVWEQIYTS
jgi:hypothetical protein